ncbi:MAG: hypothetical protein RSC14_13050 [Niameybacter sp.]
MQKWNGYETTQVMGAKKKLPAGGYICKVMEAKEEVYGWGSVLVISFDIAEGEYKNFYREQYEKQNGNKKWKGTYRVNCPKDDGSEKDEKTKKNFKTFMHHVEVSNQGYKWDWNEGKLKEKLFGGIFGEKEYEIEGNSGFFTMMRYTCEAKAAAGAPIPKPIMLKPTQSTPNIQQPTNWNNDDDFPF